MQLNITWKDQAVVCTYIAHVSMWTLFESGLDLSGDVIRTFEIPQIETEHKIKTCLLHLPKMGKEPITFFPTTYWPGYAVVQPTQYTWFKMESSMFINIQ